MNKHPDYSAYHESITRELYAIKDRIRSLVKHWPTDGEGKETALRSLLRKMLPESVIVGRGFIVAKDASSTQIDILIVDARKPTLFKDGDLFIITPDAVRAVVEVKTKMNSAADFTEALTKLSRIDKLCHEATKENRVWSGLFVFEGASNSTQLQQQVLDGLGTAYSETRRVVNCVSCGSSFFARYWDRGAEVNSNENARAWHLYELPQVAPSYFVGNLVDWLSCVDCAAASYAWFPVLGGKERYCTHRLPVGPDTETDIM